jgi:hypothetical protein
MSTKLFRITYRLQAHNVDEFERILMEEIMPLVRELGIRQPTIWRSVVGNAGEYMELWEFESLADFDDKWKELMRHPRLKKIFQVTGPMVQDENFSFLEPLD